MRNIDMTALQSMRSPIVPVMEKLHLALVNIAPERGDQFDRDYGEFAMVYLDRPSWKCGVNTETKTIYLSSLACEVTWASALAYVHLFEMMKGRDLAVAHDINLRADADRSRALDLLKWALEVWFGDRTDPWPAHLPKPMPGKKTGLEAPLPSSAWAPWPSCCTTSWLISGLGTRQAAQIRKTSATRTTLPQNGS